MKKYSLVLWFFVSSLSAQNQWTMQVWMQVESWVQGQQLGSSVGFLGKKNDSTLISVADGSGVIYIYQIKSTADTIPKYTYPGMGTVLGDFNGDGIADLVNNGNPIRMYTGLFPGVFDTIPSFTKYQESNSYVFRLSVASGNVNGDQYDDLVVTDYGYPDDSLQGRAYLFLGAPTMDTIPYRIFKGDTILAELGVNVACGDLNNDGYDEVIVKGNDNSGYATNTRFNYIRIFWGGDSLVTGASTYIKGNDGYPKGLTCFDFNGDGIDDLLWTYSDPTPTIVVQYGGPAFDTIPDVKLENPGTGPELLFFGGNLNSDGFADLVAGAPGRSQDLGAIIVYSGGPNADANFDAAAALSVQSRFGESIAPIGDVNGDGFDDLLVGAPRFKWDEYRGKWFILLGSPNIPVTSVHETPKAMPQKFQLHQNHPNPFNPLTRIDFTLARESYVLLDVYTLLGVRVETLAANQHFAGEHHVTFDGSKYPSGTYFYRLTTISEEGLRQSQTKTMILTK